MKELKQILNKKEWNLYTLYVPAIFTFFRNINLIDERKVYKALGTPTIVNLPNFIKELKNNKYWKRTISNMYENILRLFDNDEKRLSTFLGTLKENNFWIKSDDYLYNVYLLLLNLYLTILSQTTFLFQDKMQISLLKEFFSDFKIIKDLVEFVEKTNLEKFDINNFSKAKNWNIWNYYAFVFDLSKDKRKIFEFLSQQQIFDEYKKGLEFKKLLNLNKVGVPLQQEEDKYNNRKQSVNIKNDKIQDLSKTIQDSLHKAKVLTIPGLSNIDSLQLIWYNYNINLLEKYNWLDYDLLLYLWNSNKITLLLNQQFKVFTEKNNLIIKGGDKEYKQDIESLLIPKTNLVKLLLWEIKLNKKTYYPISSLTSDWIDKQLKNVLTILFLNIIIGWNVEDKIEKITYKELLETVSQKVRSEFNKSLNYMTKVNITEKPPLVRYLLEYSILTESDKYTKDIKWEFSEQEILEQFKTYKPWYITIRYLSKTDNSDDNNVKMESVTIHKRQKLFSYFNNKFSIKKDLIVNNINKDDIIIIEFDKNRLTKTIQEITRRNLIDKDESKVFEIVNTLWNKFKTELVNRIKQDKIKYLDKLWLDNILIESMKWIIWNSDNILKELLRKLYYNSIYLEKWINSFLEEVKKQMHNIDKAVLTVDVKPNKYLYIKENNYKLLKSYILVDWYKSRVISYIQWTLLRNINTLTIIALYLNEDLGKKLLWEKLWKYKRFVEEYKRSFLIVFKWKEKLLILKRKNNIEYRFYAKTKFNKSKLDSIESKINLGPYKHIIWKLENITIPENIRIDLLNSGLSTTVEIFLKL